MTVNFYSFSKKKNSTAQPVSNPTMYVCTLKERCSVVSPTIGLDLGRLTSPSSFNYAYIPDFSRYYYIKDWYWEQGLWWANLSVDVLATYKTYILQNNCYVARASKKYTGSIIDSLYPSSVMKYIDQVFWQGGSNNNPWVSGFDSGFYVVGIINNDGDSIGAISYYAFTVQQFSAFKTYLLGDTTWTGILSSNPDLGEALYKSLFNPFQYISTINWFPLSFDTSWGTQTTNLKFGWWLLQNISCYKLNQFRTQITQSLYVREHPQCPDRGRYLNGSIYSSYRLLFLPWGEFTLDGDIIAACMYAPITQQGTVKYARLDFTILIDFISGNGELVITSIHANSETATSYPLLLKVQAICCVPIQIAQITNNDIQQDVAITQGVTNGMINAFLKNPVGAIKSIVTGVSDAVEAHLPHMQEKGSNGSLNAFMYKAWIECDFSLVANDAVNDKGRPLCEEVQLSTLSPGYVLTAGAHIEIAGFEEEISSINNYLDGGVYLE